MASKKQRQRELARARYERRMANRVRHDDLVRKWSISGGVAVIVLGLIAGDLPVQRREIAQLGGLEHDLARGQHERLGQRDAQREQLGGGGHRAGSPLHVPEQPAGGP